MRHKVYLNTSAFRIVSPEQPGGDRECQLLNINNVAVTYAAIIGNFDQCVLRPLIGSSPAAHNFVQWSALISGINGFLNDVELRFPLPPPTPPGYDPDSDDSSIDDTTYDLDIEIVPAPSRPNSRNRIG